MSSSFAALAAARDASSDPSSPAAIVALEDITSSAKDTNRRASLAVAGVAALVADHLADASRGDVAGACAAGFLAAARAETRARRRRRQTRRRSTRRARRPRRRSFASPMPRTPRTPRTPRVAPIRSSSRRSRRGRSWRVSARAGTTPRVSRGALFSRASRRVSRPFAVPRRTRRTRRSSRSSTRARGVRGGRGGRGGGRVRPDASLWVRRRRRCGVPLLEAAADDDAPPGAGEASGYPRRRDRVSLRRGGAPAAVPRVGPAPPRRRRRGRALRAKLLRLAVKTRTRAR